MRSVSFGLLLILLTAGALVGGCGGPPPLGSQPLSETPTVDGVLSEWDGTLRRVGNSPVSMNVVPTDSLLYMALLIPDQQMIRSVAKHGLIVWIDPAGKKTHTYGVQYPIALRGQRPAQKSASAGSGAGLSLDQLFPSDLALIRNDTIRRRMPARLASGLRVRATMETGAFVYEIAVPVARPGGTTDGPDLGLHAPLGKAFTVGLETPSEEDSKLRGRRRGVPSVTGRGRRGRSPRGRRRGRRGRRQAAPKKQNPGVPTIEVWTSVVVRQ